MDQKDELTFWLADGMLRAGGEEVQAALLTAIRDEAVGGVSLEQAVAESTKFERKPGDFGAEIVVPILLPILIEALKVFWVAFAPELQKKVMGELAGFTVERAKDIFRKAVGGTDKAETLSRLKASILDAAKKKHLDEDTTNRLIAMIENPRLPATLETSEES